MAERLEDLLRACTVRVLGPSSGTGFFVAPGKVLTCWHVVSDVAAPEDSGPDLAVVWNRDEQSPVQIQVTGVRKLPSRGRAVAALAADYPDVAVLDVDAPDGHPCAMLDTGRPADDDEFRAYGFPKEGGSVRLAPVRLGYRGTHGSSPTAYLDLNLDTVKPGMSGAAVLNLRTRRVCGIIVASKHPQRADGALAVPWAEIKADLGGVLAESEAFHDRDPAWAQAAPEVPDIAGRDPAAPRVDPKTQADSDRLAELVLKQAQVKRSRLIGTDRPGVDTANVAYARADTGWLREADGRETGDLRGVLEYYRSLSPQRLVILGDPGAGKTVLLLELQIQLLEERYLHPERPVPVLISASACDTTKSWEDWLAGQVSLEFSFSVQRAAALVSSRRILPLVDGLDEMDSADSSPERAQTLVRALNEWLRGSDLAPVVASCRRGEYNKLAEGIDKARHAELRGLTGREAAAYLRGQFRTSNEQERWAGVLETLERDPGKRDPENIILAAELATPWKLTLALAVFRDVGDPAWLLPPENSTESSYSARVERYPAWIESLLLDSYLFSAVRLYQKGTRYTYLKVQRWAEDLASGLAEQADGGRSATDITLHDWRRKETRTAQLCYAALVLLPLVVVSVADTAAVNAALPAIFALSASGAFLPRDDGSQRNFSRKNSVTRIGSGLTAGLTAGITTVLAVGLWAWVWIGPVAGLENALAYGLAYGLAAGLVTGFTCKLTNGPATWLPPWLACGIAIGLMYWIVSWFLYGFASGRGFELLGLGLVYGLIYGLGAAPVAKLAESLTNFSPKSRRPLTLVQTNGLLGFAGGLVAGLAGGLTLRPITDLANRFAAEFGFQHEWWYGSGIAFGIGFGLTVWFAISGRIWLRYHCFVAWNALRRRSPLRFGKFLDWAVHAGLLREAGISYQFRHRQLQERLAGETAAESGAAQVVEHASRDPR